MSTSTTFDLSTTKPAPTVTLPLYHPVTGEELPVTAECAGFYTAAERAASHALADAEAEAEGKPTDTAAAHARYRAFVEAILTGIPGGVIDGAPVVIASRADAARVLEALPWVVEQVFSAYVGQLAFFGRRRPS